MVFNGGSTPCLVTPKRKMDKMFSPYSTTKVKRLVLKPLYRNIISFIDLLYCSYVFSMSIKLHILDMWHFVIDVSEVSYFITI